MALDSNNVLRAVTGVVSSAAISETLPTAVNSALGTNYKDLGWISEDGITRTHPGAGDREVVRGWQNNGVVMIIRTPSGDNPTFQFVMLESKIEVVQFALDVVVTQSSTDGKWVVDAEAARVQKRVILDVVHGARAHRIAIPRAVVTEIGDQVFAFGQPVGWEVTVEAERDAVVGGHFIEWDSAFKTP